MSGMFQFRMAFTALAITAATAGLSLYGRRDRLSLPKTPSAFRAKDISSNTVK